MNNNKVNSGLPEVQAYIDRGVLEWWSDFNFGFRPATSSAESNADFGFS